MNSTNLHLCFDESHIKLPDHSDLTHCDLKNKSILKPPKIRAPLQEVDFGFDNSIDPDVIRKRRVSFAGVNKIKEFHSKAESVIICSTPAYEETFSTSSDSSALALSSGGASSGGDDCTLMNDAMDLTDLAIDTNVNNPLGNEKAGTGGFFDNSLLPVSGVGRMQNITMNRGGVDQCHPNFPAQVNKHPTSDPTRLLLNALLDDSNILEDSSSEMASKNQEMKNHLVLNPINQVADFCEKPLSSNSVLDLSDSLPQNNIFPFKKSDHISNQRSFSGMEFTEAVPNTHVQERYRDNQFSQTHTQLLKGNASSNFHKVEMELTEVIPRVLNHGGRLNCLSTEGENNCKVAMQCHVFNTVSNTKNFFDSSQTMDFTEVLQPKTYSNKGTSIHNKDALPSQGNIHTDLKKIDFENTSSDPTTINNFASSQMEFTEALVFPMVDQKVGRVQFQSINSTYSEPSNVKENDINYQEEMETSLMECTEVVPNQFRNVQCPNSERNFHYEKANIQNRLPDECFEMEFTEAIPERGLNVNANPSLAPAKGAVQSSFSDFPQEVISEINKSQSIMEFTEAIPPSFGKNAGSSGGQDVGLSMEQSLKAYSLNSPQSIMLQQAELSEVSNNVTAMEFTEAIPHMRPNTENISDFTYPNKEADHNRANETLMELTEALPPRVVTKDTTLSFKSESRNSQIPTLSASDHSLEMQPNEETKEKSSDICEISQRHISPVRNESFLTSNIPTKSPEFPAQNQANNSQIDFTDMLLPVVKEINASHLQKRLIFSVNGKKDACDNTQMDFTEALPAKKCIQTEAFTDRKPEVEMDITETSSMKNTSETKANQPNLHVSVNDYQMLNENSCQLVDDPRLNSSRRETSIITNKTEADPEEKILAERLSAHNSSDGGYGSIQRGNEITPTSNNITHTNDIETELIYDNNLTVQQKNNDCNEEAHFDELNMSVDVSFSFSEDIIEKGMPLHQVEKIQQESFPKKSQFTTSKFEQRILNGETHNEEKVLSSALENKLTARIEELPKSQNDNLTECIRTSSLASFMCNNVCENPESNENKEVTKRVFCNREEEWQIMKRNRSFMNSISFSFVSRILWRRSLPWPVDILIKIPFTDVNMKTETVKIKLVSKVGERDKIGSLTDYCMKKNMNLLLSEEWLNSECRIIKDLLVAIRLVEEEYTFLDPLVSCLKFLNTKTYWNFNDSQLLIPLISSKMRYYCEIRVSLANYKKISGKDVDVINRSGKVSCDEVQNLFEKFLPSYGSEDQFWLFVRSVKQLLSKK